MFRMHEQASDVQNSCYYEGTNAFISRSTDMQDGELYTCGSNESGQLGFRPTISDQQEQCSHSTPSRVNALESHRVLQVACGQNHTVAVLDSGAIASFGASEFGQLGQGSESTIQPLPRVVRGTPGMRFLR